MTEIKCKFCNKNFANIYNLQTHQNSAKYCLEIQNKDLEKEFKCEHCNKVFTRNNYLNKHIAVCKEFEKNQYINQFKNNQKEIEALKKENKKLNDIIINLRVLETELKSKNDMIFYKDSIIKNLEIRTAELQQELKYFHEKTLEKAIEKTNVTQVHNATTNNIVNQKSKMIQSLEPLTLKAIEEQAKCIKVDSVKNHAVSLAEFFYQNVLKGKVVLNDASRNIFSYKDEYGKISRDEGGIKISNMIISASRDQIYTCCVEYLKFLDSTPRLLRNDKYYDLCDNLQKIGKICINKNNPNNSEYFEAFKKTFMNHLKDLVGFGKNEDEIQAIENQPNILINRDSIPIKDNFLVENKEKMLDLLTRYSEFLDIKAEEQGDYKDDESYLTAVLEGLDHLNKNEKVNRDSIPIKDLYNTKQFMMNFYRGIANLKIYKDDIIQKGLLTEEEIKYLNQF